MILFCLLCVCLAMPALAADEGYVSGVISKNVSIRVSPDARSQRLVYAPNGSLLTVTGEQENWLAVDFTDSKGVAYSGWAQSAYVVRGAMTVTLLSSNVPAYSAPSRKAKLVGSLSKDTELTVIGTWGSYYIVNLRQAAAYIPKSADLEVSAGNAADIENQISGYSATTLTDTLLRSGPGRTWRSQTIIPSGSSVTVTNITEDGWAQVNYQGYSGYVLLSDLSLGGMDLEVMDLEDMNQING